MIDIKQCVRDGESPFQKKVKTLADFGGIIRKTGRPFFVYGASPVTEYLIDRMLKLDLLPKCLCDSDARKHGTKMFMLPVTSPESAVESNPDAICAIGIKAIATCYNEIFTRLESAGCTDYYIIDWDFCHYTVPDEWKADLTDNIDAVALCADKFDDTLSRQRYNEFILAYLSGKVSSRDCLASFKPKDGYYLQNDLLALKSTDVLLSCRCGLDRKNERFIETIKNISQAHLLEPTLSGRIRTSELLSDTEDKILLYPFYPSASNDTVEFDERHCFVKYIDLEDFNPTTAPPVALDALIDAKPTVLYLDMTGRHIEALKSAEGILNTCRPTLILTGFRLGSEVSKIIEAYPGFKWHMRHFGGQNMREGYALIAYF